MVVAIQVQQTVEDGQAYAARYGLRYTIGADVTGTIFHAYKVFALPTQFFIDTNGVVRQVVNGPLDEARAAQMIESILPPGRVAERRSGRELARAELGQHGVDGLDEPVRIGVGEHHGRLDLDHVVIRAIRAEQDAALGGSVDQLAGEPGVGRARLAVAARARCPTNRPAPRTSPIAG